MYVSGTYGGAFTAILFRIPGEPIDVPLLWDGYAMARARASRPRRSAGRCSRRLAAGWSPRSSWWRSRSRCAKVALTFSSPEYFAIVLFGLLERRGLGGGSLANAFISLFIGMLISTVGVDGIYGVDRFTFGITFCATASSICVVMVGAYGLGEVLMRLETGLRVAAARARRQDRTHGTADTRRS